MSRRLLTGLLTTLVLAGCSKAPPASPTLAGEWTPVSAALGGADFPVANFGGATLKLTANTYELASDKGTYALVTTDPPAKMDIRGTEGPNAGRSIPAIYALSADTLTICYQLGEGERPGEFASPAGSRVLLVRYTRVP